MRPSIRNWLALVGFGLAATLGCAGAQAAYPDHAVHIIVGYGPGGNGDLLARALAQGLAEKWHQPVVVENRVGGGTTIAADYVAHAAPDGYTILFGSSALTIPVDFKLNYDIVTSFAPSVVIASSPEVIVAAPSLPVASLKELIALAKAKPGLLNFGSTGVGSQGWVEMQVLMSLTGMHLESVPYKGGAETLLGLMRGDIQTAILGLLTAADPVKAGTIKGLAVTSKIHPSLLPNVPSVAEAVDLASYDSTLWYGWLAPKGTPAAIVQQLHDDTVAVMASDASKKMLTEMGFDAIGMGPADFAKMIAGDVPRWQAALKNVPTK